jgi:glycosyltransferase involved in cell wall biosynthesis
MATVSIIICIYRGEEYIKKCLDSVLQQTYDDIEVVLVDDGSPDTCPEICDNYAEKDNRITVIHKTNGGLGCARNTGIAAAKGKYVTFVDQDDWIKEDCIDRMVYEIEKNESDMVVSGIYRYFNPNKIKEIKETDVVVNYEGDEVIKKVLAPIIGADESNPVDVEREMCVFRNLYKKSIIDEHQVKLASEREYLSDDLFFNMEYMSFCKKVTFIPDILYYYRANEGSMTANLSPNEYQKEKALYLGAKEIVRKHNIEGMVGRRCERLFLTDVRRTIILTVGSKQQFSAKYRAIRDILNDSTLVEVMKDYPFGCFTPQKKVMAYLMKYRCVIGVYFVTMIHNNME